MFKRFRAHVVAMMLAAGAPAFAGCALPPPGARPHGPPPEAFAACVGKTAGDAVSLTVHDGKVLNATCELRDGALVARPEGKRHGGPDGKPDGPRAAGPVTQPGGAAPPPGAPTGQAPKMPCS